MKIIIAGSRSFSDYQLLSEKMDKLTAGLNVTVISGHARGADQLGEQWAKKKGIPLEIYPAEWEKYGRSAGPIRNRQMANISDALVVFWDGASQGTKNMIDVARQNGLKVRVITYK